jgi:hypothetical protein
MEAAARRSRPPAVRFGGTAAPLHGSRRGARWSWRLSRLHTNPGVTSVGPVTRPGCTGAVRSRGVEFGEPPEVGPYGNDVRGCRAAVGTRLPSSTARAAALPGERHRRPVSRCGRTARGGWEELAVGEAAVESCGGGELRWRAAVESRSMRLLWRRSVCESSTVGAGRRTLRMSRPAIAR